MHNNNTTLPGLAGLNAFWRQSTPDSKSPENAHHQAMPEDIADATQILNSLPECICSLDKLGNWQNQSPGNCKYFRSLNATNFNRWVNEAVHVQDRILVLKAVNDCRMDNKSAFAEFRILNNSECPDIPAWAEIRCTPLPAEGTLLTVLRDISNQKQLENQIVDARDQADQSNSAKTRFLANMSHELRTPLNAIIGFSDILKSGMVAPDDKDKQHEYQSLISSSAHHLLHLLNDILDMSKIEAGKYEIYPEEVDLVSIINSCCSMLAPLADKASVKLNVIEPENQVVFEADSRAIRQIIINIVTNAIKFTQTDTKVDISARRLGRMVEFQVKDQGKGIATECLDGLGDPFYQVDGEKSRHHEGAGLGLSIVKGLVQLHGGTFSIKSKLNVGTTVTITLATSLGNNAPVPADDADTIIRIRPPSSQDREKISSISRLVG